MTEGALRVMVRAGFDDVEALLAFGEFIRKVVDLVYAEYARKEEVLNGRHPLEVMRDRADGVPDTQIPHLRSALDKLRNISDSGLAVDLLFEWNVRLEIYGLSELLARAEAPLWGSL
jgi:hypothetical protein